MCYRNDVHIVYGDDDDDDNESHAAASTQHLRCVSVDRRLYMCEPCAFFL